MWEILFPIHRGKDVKKRDQQEKKAKSKKAICKWVEKQKKIIKHAAEFAQKRQESTRTFGLTPVVKKQRANLQKAISKRELA